METGLRVYSYGEPVVYTAAGAVIGHVGGALAGGLIAAAAGVVHGAYAGYIGGALSFVLPNFSPEVTKSSFCRTVKQSISKAACLSVHKFTTVGIRYGKHLGTLIGGISSLSLWFFKNNSESLVAQLLPNASKV